MAHEIDILHGICSSVLISTGEICWIYMEGISSEGRERNARRIVVLFVEAPL